MRRNKIRFCNYCHFKLRPFGQPRFISFQRGDTLFSEWDTGEDFSITFKTRKGKIMDFCSDRCRHSFYYGKRTPLGQHPIRNKKPKTLIGKIVATLKLLWV